LAVLLGRRCCQRSGVRRGLPLSAFVDVLFDCVQPVTPSALSARSIRLKTDRGIVYFCVMIKSAKAFTQASFDKEKPSTPELYRNSTPTNFARPQSVAQLSLARALFPCANFGSIMESPPSWAYTSHPFNHLSQHPDAYRFQRGNCACSHQAV
jgi:hypothetical protein